MLLKTYEKIISKNNISIKFNKTENFKIIGDRDKLIEIFTNLIDNSIKYSDKNKEITITAKKDGGLIRCFSSRSGNRYSKRIDT